MKFLWIPFLMTTLLVWPSWADDDPEKKARQALIAAEKAASSSGKPCQAGEYEKCVEAIKDVQRLVEEAKDLLDGSGINPSRNPRHHKDAEIRTRKILKHLQALEPYIHPEDREIYDAVVQRISTINDQILLAIMSRPKK